ncbi:hypothetical protein SLS62_004759 [Diatrype stigma]|uniref:Uncharacterized protein n=1 Tax=Diatrype stigma TaxID=117547 RepID=A0AAN9UQP0_9PEZI
MALRTNEYRVTLPAGGLRTVETYSIGAISADDSRIHDIKVYLEDIAKNGITSVQERGRKVISTPQETIIDDIIHSSNVRIFHLKDVVYDEEHSYSKADRAKAVERASNDKMRMIEPPMGRDTENLLMAQRMSRGEAPIIPQHKDGSKNHEKWYKEMRLDSRYMFWVKADRARRDELRATARTPPDEFTHLIQQIKIEDKCHTKDAFWDYQRDEAAATEPNIYQEVQQHVVIVLDKNSQVILCKFSGLFQLLFGAPRMHKVEDAIRKWSSLAPLPIPNTRRYMVDAYIRQKHPEMDVEKAQSLEEIEERHQCIVHYGCWGMKGHLNPDHVFPTPDTRLRRAYPRAVQEEYVSDLLPTFQEKVLGIGSEVARFLFSALAPEEYRECCAVFEALRDTEKMRMSEPTFATLAVLGINSYTARHRDQTDVKHGFASLLPLGSYQAAVPAGRLRDVQGGRARALRLGLGGYRIFLLHTNHQPVRNYAHRVMGRLKPKPNDPWHPDRSAQEEEERGAGVRKKRLSLASPSGPQSALYNPCYTEPLSMEPEELSAVDIHGAGIDDTPSTSSNGSKLLGASPEGAPGIGHAEFRPPEKSDMEGNE